VKVGVFHPYWYDGIVGGGETLIRQLQRYLPDVEFEILGSNLRFENKMDKLCWSNAAGLAKMFDRLDVDLIHSHFPCATYPLQLRKPVLMTVHGYIGDYPRQGGQHPARLGWYKMLEAWERFNIRHATHSVAVSEYAGLKMGCHEVIHNGIGLEEVKVGRKPYPDGTKKNILYFGRVSREKGLDRLVDAIGNDMNLWVAGPIGDGLYWDIIHIPKNNIHYLGVLGPEKYAYMHYADKVVFPSRSEGFSIAAVEALASGAEIIAADVPGLREPLGECALYFKDKEGLRLALATETDMGYYARSRARRFDIRTTAGRYEKIYKEMVG
jgi:glycosyltransferase involved in cell wall biosynthesis